MKLNHKQALLIVDFLYKNAFISKCSYSAIALGELFDEEIKEARVINRYGMAGKLWNSNGRIYISGHNDSEIGYKQYQLEQTEIKSANDNIAAIIEMYRDVTDSEADYMNAQ